MINIDYGKKELITSVDYYHINKDFMKDTIERMVNSIVKEVDTASHMFVDGMKIYEKVNVFNDECLATYTLKYNLLNKRSMIIEIKEEGADYTFNIHLQTNANPYLPLVKDNVKLMRTFVQIDIEDEVWSMFEHLNYKFNQEKYVKGNM